MTVERPVDFGERGERQEDLIITAQSLYEDNRSAKAQEIIAGFNEAQSRGDLTLVGRCSDARLKSIGEGAVSIGSVASGLTVSEKVVKDKGVGRSVILTHFDGDKFEPGEIPAGCGGLAAKGNHQSIEGTEIEPYIDGYIPDKDPLVQSVRVAEQIADISDKPTAAWVIDHLTDRIYPVAFFQKNESAMTQISAIRQYDINSANPERIYEDGIPTIDEGLLPDDFQELLEKNRQEQQAILSRYPDLRKMQKVQNPRAVLFSTDIRSAKKFPKIASIPGSIFKVFANREKLGDINNISAEDMELAFRQLWYAITNSVKSSTEDGSGSFAQTDRLIIETPDLDLSRTVAENALQKQWMKEWMRLNDRRIILLQTNSGLVNNASEIAL